MIGADASAVARSPVAPMAGLVAFGTALAYVGCRSPERAGRYPVCPFHAATGLWCPGCGSLRAMHALANGDLITAVHRNVLLIGSLPLLAYGWLWWLRRSFDDGRARPAPRVFSSLSVVAALVAFGVLRNLPGFGFLAP
jgi:hypothetical protein